MTEDSAVWITGVGTANPLGVTFAATADGFLAGRSGVRPVTRFDASAHCCRIAADIEAPPAPDGCDEAEFAALWPAERFFLWSAVQALRDAGLWERRSDPRLGLVLGYGAENILTWQCDWEKGGRGVQHPEQEAPPALDRLAR